MSRPYPAPAVDPELREALELVRGAIPAVGLTAESVADLRAAFAHVPSADEVDPEGAYEFAELVASDEGSPDVPVVVATPRHRAGPSPVLLYAHGGGLVAGHRWSNLGDLVSLAASVGAVVVSIEYRLAPEHPYPAALDDCSTALQWVRRSVEPLGHDGTIVVAGTSAGAGLVAALALRERDRHRHRHPVRTDLAGQLLCAPMLDDASSSFSAAQMSGLGVWDEASNRTGWQAYLAGTGEAEREAAVPARATDLTGLPPAFLDVADGETFRDEVVAYADRIWRAGGSAELHVWPGGFHGFDAMVPASSLAADAKEARRRWLRRVVALRSRATAGLLPS